MLNYAFLIACASALHYMIYFSC